MSSSPSTTTTTLSFILFAAVLSLALVRPSLSQTSPSPSPPSGPVNLTAILEKGGQYTFLIRLLNTTQVTTQIKNQLNTSSEGLTILAPTDNAFNSLAAGTINNLTPQQQVQLVLNHVLPKYYSLQSFLTVSNPLRTQANYGLNFTGQGNQVNVSTGMVDTRINNALYQQQPLAVYEVDRVLLPSELFQSPAPVSSPPAPSKNGGSSSNTTTPSTPAKSGGSVVSNGIRTMGFFVGIVGMVFIGGFA